ncbi:hypothetical protein [Longirhabdus pacifica]|uniref:hypothetical protein n=1 Tax=Longirhabdus pacifica TaxID=2305227 RepID=UPI001008AB1C|nr:hypothetical protein [Longirhabdus pacifica]
MITQEQMVDIVKQVSGDLEVTMNSTFEKLNMDSTNIVEILIEVEMVMDMDILDSNINLYEMLSVKDIYNYLKELEEK